MKIVYFCPYGFSDKIGAEQKDLIATLHLLRGIKHISVIWLSLNLSTGEIIDVDNDETLPTSNLTLKNIFTYLKYKFVTYDRSMAKPFKLSTFCTLKDFIYTNNINVIVTSTNSTALYGVSSGVKHIFRSLNYEPLHVLGEVENLFKARILSFLKYLSVRLELKADILWAISPRDLELYKSHSNSSSKKILLLPLSQFAMMRSYNSKKTQRSRLNIGYLGSSYKVLHNRRGLENILACFSQFENNKLFKLNIYGKKSDLVINNLGNNVIFKGWVKKLSEIYSSNDIFIVPYVGGAGMQSKVFEPIINGKILICDPRVIAGYDFTAHHHYLPAITCQEIIKQLNWIIRNEVECNKIRRSAKKQAVKIFDKNIFENVILTSLKSFS